MTHLNELIEEHRLLVELPTRLRSTARRIAQLDLAIDRQLAVANEILRQLKSLSRFDEIDPDHLDEDIRIIDELIRKADADD